MTVAASVDETAAGDFQALRLANEHIAVTVVPERGADVLDLEDVPRELSVLWRSPMWGRSPRRRPGLEASTFFDYYPGGMQEVFPSGGPPCEYEGAQLPFHGEACQVPWDYEVAEGEDGVELICTTRLARLPFSLRKTFSLNRGERAIRIDAAVTNHGRRRLHYMWGFHPALGGPVLGEQTVVHCPARRLRVHPEPFGSSQQLPPGTECEWPLVEGRDLSVLSPPSQSAASLWYLDQLDSGWYVVENPERDLLVTMSWEVERFPYLWLWQECYDDTGAPWFGAQHVVGVEPWSSYPASGLPAAIENGSAPTIAAGETHGTSLSIGITTRGGVRGDPTGVDAGEVSYGGNARSGRSPA